MGPEWADLVALPPRHRIYSLAARCASSEVDRRATWACWRRYGRGRTASSRVQRRIADVRPLPTVLKYVALFVRLRALVSLVAERLDRFHVHIDSLGEVTLGLIEYSPNILSELTLVYGHGSQHGLYDAIVAAQAEADETADERVGCDRLVCRVCPLFEMSLTTSPRCAHKGWHEMF